MKYRKTLALSLLLFLSFTFALNAKPSRNNVKISSPGMNMQRRAAVLSEEEQKQLYQIKMDYEKKVLPLRAEIRVLNIEINQMIASGKSGKELDAAVDKLSNLRSKLNKEQVARRVALRSALGEDKFRQMGSYQYKYQEQGRGTQMNMHRSYNNRRSNCYYSNTPHKRRPYRR